MAQPDLVTISSYNAPETQRSSDFEAVLGNSIIYPKKICITKFVMPNWIYDISPNYNQIVITAKLTSSGALTTATAIISSTTHWASGGDFATYLGTTLSSALQTAGTVANLITATFSATTGKLTLSIIAGWTFYLTPWNNPDPISAKSALYKIGFTNVNGAGYDQSFVTTLTGDSLLNLLGTTIIYIACSLLGNAQNDKKAPDGTVVGDETILCTVPVNGNFGELILYQDMFSQYIDCNINSIRTIRITLLNEEYNIITLPRGCYATIEFRMKYD